MFKNLFTITLGLLLVSQVGYGDTLTEDQSNTQIENTNIENKQKAQYDKYVAIYKRLQSTYPQASKEELKNYSLEILQEKNIVDNENSYNKNFVEHKKTLENKEEQNN